MTNINMAMSTVLSSGTPGVDGMGLVKTSHFTCPCCLQNFLCVWLLLWFSLCLVPSIGYNACSGLKQSLDGNIYNSLLLLKNQNKEIKVN